MHPPALWQPRHDCVPVFHAQQFLPVTPLSSLGVTQHLQQPISQMQHAAQIRVGLNCVMNVLGFAQSKYMPDGYGSG